MHQLLLVWVCIAAPIGSKATIDRTIAHVNDTVIWQSELDARMRSEDPKNRAAVLDAMIDEELVVLEGKRAMVVVDKSEVLAALAEIKAQNNIDDKQLEVVLAESGYTRARYLVDLEKQLLILRTKNQFVAPMVDITDAQVAAELKARSLTDKDKETVQREMRRAAFDAKTAVWVAGLRKRAWIERRP
jgi:parvulin-like peptidyl-prolyl isomerase